MDVVAKIRATLLCCDLEMAQQGFQGGFSISIGKKAGSEYGGEPWVKHLHVTSGKLADITHAGKITTYPGFSLANAFDQYAADNFANPKLLIVKRVLSDDTGTFDDMAGTFAANWYDNHDDDRHEDIEEILERNENANMLTLYTVYLYRTLRKATYRHVLDCSMVEFDQAASKDAVLLKMHLS